MDIFSHGEIPQEKTVQVRPRFSRVESMSQGFEVKLSSGYKGWGHRLILSVYMNEGYVAHRSLS